MELGIPNHLKYIFMHAISSSQMRVNWNGNKGSYFKSMKGLRQGDLVSPYLFMMCMDKLFHLILGVMDNKHWVGIKVGWEDPFISHLMFTTDLLLFSHATESQIANMMEVLDDLCAASSQLTSKEKTRITFSSNTPVGIRRNIATLYGFREIEDLGLYLGVPLSGKSPRINNYQFLIDKVCAKLSHLRCNQLSFDGRVTLSKLVI